MSHVEIYPEGTIEPGIAVLDNTTYIRFDLKDVDGDDSVTIVFRKDHFVKFANHLKMIADQLP